MGSIGEGAMLDLELVDPLDSKGLFCIFLFSFKGLLTWYEFLEGMRSFERGVLDRLNMN